MHHLCRFATQDAVEASGLEWTYIITGRQADRRAGLISILRGPLVCPTETCCMEDTRRQLVVMALTWQSPGTRQPSTITETAALPEASDLPSLEHSLSVCSSRRLRALGAAHMCCQPGC
jgi:hypothetical protein